MQLHFRSYGAGAPLVILHGLFGSLDNWHTVSQRLGGHFHVLAVDQRNHGRSPHCPEMDYRLMADDVAEFLDQQQLAEAFVLGHSMGGKTAMQLALAHPRRVARLVVADMAPRAYPPRHEKILAGMLALDLAAAASRHQLAEALAPWVPELATRQFLLKNVAADAEGRFHWRCGLDEIHRNYGRLAEALAASPPYPGPTLFLRGERSDFLREEDEPGIRQLFPHAELGTIPRAGHLLHADNPEAFLRAVSGFLI